MRPALACLLLGWLGLVFAAEPAADAIAKLIRQLDDDQFADREAATQKLIEVGKAAIAPLAKAAVGDNPEVTERALRILGELSKSKDAATAESAKSALTKIAASDHAGAAARARGVLLAGLNQALAELEKAGATVQIASDKVVAVNMDRVQDLKATLPLLHKLPDLEDLSLSNPSMNDESMALLKGLPKLQHLNLFQSKIGDEGLKHLKQLPALRSAPMGQTQVTDAGLIHLKDLTQLEYLGLRGNHVTDAGLVHLKKLTNLTGLYLGETKVTDAGLVHLRGMTKMTYLRLHTVVVSDAGLEHLKALTKLQRLDLWETKATAEGVEKLKKAIPGLAVLTEE